MLASVPNMNKAFFAGVAFLAIVVSGSVRAANYAMYTTVGEVNTQTSSAGADFLNQYRFSVRQFGGQSGNMILRKPDGSLMFANPFAPGQNIFPSREALAAEFPSGT